MRITRLVPVFVAVSLSLILAGPAFAHGHTHIGDYELVIGFLNEPADLDDLKSIPVFVRYGIEKYWKKRLTRR